MTDIKSRSKSSNIAIHHGCGKYGDMQLLLCTVSDADFVILFALFSAVIGRSRVTCQIKSAEEGTEWKLDGHVKCSTLSPAGDRDFPNRGEIR